MLHLEAPSAFGGSKAEQIESDMAHDGKVVCGVVGPGAHPVVTEDDVHAPMKTFLDAPVLANRPVQALGIGRQAADVETEFTRGFVLEPIFLSQPKASGGELQGMTVGGA